LDQTEILTGKVRVYIKLPGDKLEQPDQVLISGTGQQIEECFQAWDQKRRNTGF
jgi:hypothetical protein